MQLEILFLTLNGTRRPSIEIISHWQSSLDKRFSQCCPLEGTLESINTLKIGILVTYPQIHEPLLATLLYLLSIYSYQFQKELKHNLLMLNIIF